MSVKINQYIEHTNLSSVFTDQNVHQLISECKEYQFLGVCLPPFWVKKAKREIDKSPIRLVTVAGFPFGYNMTETKMEEVKLALRNGADEVDVVMNISAFKAGMGWAKIELAKCASLLHEHEKLLKVIIETAYLSDKEIVKACKMCAEAGADFVKTSTGYASKGAEPEKIRLMRSILPKEVGIKASGGIRSAELAISIIEEGADRIGTSSSVAIIKELDNNKI